jgi:hypothetical protein
VREWSGLKCLRIGPSGCCDDSNYVERPDACSALLCGYLVLRGDVLLLQALDSSKDHEHCGNSRDPRHEQDTASKEATVTRRSHNKMDKWLGHTMEDVVINVLLRVVS